MSALVPSSGLKPAIKEYPVEHLYLSHTTLRLLHSCARKFEFRKLFKHPAREFGLAAELGKALHKGLQTYLTTKSEDEAILAYMLAYPVHLCQNNMDPRSLEAGYNTLMAMINSTPLLEYEIAQIRCLDGELRPAIEVPFEITFDGYRLSDRLPITVSYCGFIDAIFWDKVNQEFIVLDIKTTGKIDQDLSPKFAFSEQCVPYALVLNAMEGKLVEGFSVKYLVCKVDILEPSVQIHTFQKSKEDVEDWFRGVLVNLANIRMFIEMDWFPRNGGGDTCFSYNRRCLYYDLCTTRDKNAIQEIILNEGEEGKYEIPQLEQADNNLLVHKFEPWIKFGVTTPDLGLVA